MANISNEQLAGGAGALFAGSAGLGHYGSQLAWSRAKRMAQNQIQWRVADMKAAGLNPLLAVTQSGGGAGAQPPPQYGDMASTAKTAMAMAQLRQVNAQIDNTEADTATKRQEKDRWSPFGTIGKFMNRVLQSTGHDVSQTYGRNIRQYTPELAEQIRRQAMTVSPTPLHKPRGKAAQRQHTKQRANQRASRGRRKRGY